MGLNLLILLQKYPKYILDVQAADREGEGMTALGHVILTVTDSNDNAPAFKITQASTRVKTFHSPWNQTHFFHWFSACDVSVSNHLETLTWLRLPSCETYSRPNYFEAEILLENKFGLILRAMVTHANPVPYN